MLRDTRLGLRLFVLRRRLCSYLAVMNFLQWQRKNFAFENLCAEMNFLVRVIGMPPESEWPDVIPLPRSSFRISRQQRLEDLVPNMDPEGLNLMKVKFCSKPCSLLLAIYMYTQPSISYFYVIVYIL